MLTSSAQQQEEEEQEVRLHIKNTDYEPVVYKLRSEVYFSVYYIDDSLLLGNDLQSCLDNVNATAKVLKSAGSIINHYTSRFRPYTKITFRGFYLIHLKRLCRYHRKGASNN